jgi:hypothetical protein
LPAWLLVGLLLLPVDLAQFESATNLTLLLSPPRFIDISAWHLSSRHHIRDMFWLKTLIDSPAFTQSLRNEDMGDNCRFYPPRLDWSRSELFELLGALVLIGIMK